ncbi:MAG: RodZ domain-containing protein [Hydrogenophilaceae bacterium]
MSELIAQGYGQILAQAREAKGMTVAQVAEKLKLTSRQIEALETEDESRLPATVFVRGFIRNYARLVGVPLDSLPVVAEAPTNPTETITAHSEELRFRASPVRRWLLLPMAVFGLFLVLVALLYTWLRQGEEAYVPAGPAVSTQPLPAPAVPAPVEGVPAEPAPVVDPAAPTTLPPAPVAPAMPMSASPAPAPSGSQAVVQPVPPAPASPVAPAPAKPVAPTPAKPVAPAAAPAPASAPSFSSPFSIFSSPPAQTPVPARASHTLQLVAEETDSWIEVVSGDDKHYSRLLRAGEQLTLRGTPPFRLVVGSAATVRLSYDGKTIDLRPYTGDKVARLTLE